MSFNGAPPRPRPDPPRSQVAYYGFVSNTYPSPRMPRIADCLICGAPDQTAGDHCRYCKRIVK